MNTHAAGTDLVVVDSGGANLGSVMIALRRLGIEPPLVRDAESIQRAGRVLLPGVGAAGPVMQRLDGLGLIEVLRNLRVPLLGICVGMQVLYQGSEENDVQCLGVLPGMVRQLRRRSGIRIPHMGWNTLQPVDLAVRPSPLLNDIDADAFAYFVHSYAAPVDAYCVAQVDHGQQFAALVQHGNIAGAQFHPERSATVGAQLLRNFLSWQP